MKSSTCFRLQSERERVRGCLFCGTGCQEFSTTSVGGGWSVAIHTVLLCLHTLQTPANTVYTVAQSDLLFDLLHALFVL